MPHLVLYYTAHLDSAAQLTPLCRALADVMVAAIDETGGAVFPPGGVRVLAYPAAHSAVSDGSRDEAHGPDGFLYLNLRMKQGRSPAVHTQVGDALLAQVKTHLAAVFNSHYIGVTLQIDEGAEVYDGKHSNIHPLYAR